LKQSVKLLALAAPGKVIGTAGAYQYAMSGTDIILQKLLSTSKEGFFWFELPT